MAVKVRIIQKMAILSFRSTSIHIYIPLIGRTDPNFIDHNETLIDELIAKYPKMTTLEMESYHL